MKSTAGYGSPLAQTCVEHLVVWLDRGLVMVPTTNKPLQSFSGSDQDYLLSVTVFTPAQTPISPFHIWTPDNIHNRIRISSTFAGSHKQHTTIDCPCQTCPHGSEVLCMVRARGRWRGRNMHEAGCDACSPLDLTDNFGINLNHICCCRRRAELLFFFTLSYLCFFFFVVKRQLHASLVIHALNLSLWTHSGRFSALRGGK